MEDQGSSRKRLRDDRQDELLELAEVKRLRDDLLGFLDDSDPVPGAPDLDSLMRSFQDEIAAASSSAPAAAEVVEVVDLTVESSSGGDSRSELGYLLGASDDELGLPPSTTPSSGEEAAAAVAASWCEAELVRAASEASGIGEFWEFEDGIPSYPDPYHFGAAAGGGGAYGGGDDDDGQYVAFDRLFDYSDEGFDASDQSGFLWRRGETMPAL